MAFEIYFKDRRVYLKKPWNINKQLKNDRLITIAQILRTVRDGSVEEHNPKKGDGKWGLGTRVYERSLNILVKKSAKYEWLEIYKMNLFFIILIDGLPVRYFKGEVSSPPKKSLHSKYRYIEEAMQLPFEEDEFLDDYLWRISVQPDEDGNTLSVFIAQYDNVGDNYNSYKIPLDAQVTVLRDSSYAEKDSKKIIMPPPKMKKTNIEQNENSK